MSSDGLSLDNSLVIQWNASPGVFYNSIRTAVEHWEWAGIPLRTSGT